MGIMYIKAYNNGNKPTGGQMLFEFIVGAISYSIILLITSKVFNGFFIDGFWTAFAAALIISLLNQTIKPLLFFLTLPLTIFTLGIMYPIVNLIILKIAGWILGSSFVLEGFFIPFIIAIFISILKIVFDGLIVKPVTRRKK